MANSWQIEFKDPSKEWKLINAWFIKQTDFDVRFTRRQLISMGDVV